MHQMLLSRYFREELQQRIWGGGSVLGRPRRVLLGYTRCLGSATREGGAAPGCGELQDPGPLRVLLAPKVRWGCSDWTEASGLGEGSGLEMSRDSSQGGRGKTRLGKVGYSRLHGCVCGPDRNNSEPEEVAVRSSASFSCSFVKLLCQFETPPGDVWAHCCCGFIKGARVESRTTADPTHVPTGGESDQGSRAHRLQGTSALRTGLPPSSHLLVRSPGTPKLAPPPGPGFWDSLEVMQDPHAPLSAWGQECLKRCNWLITEG